MSAAVLGAVLPGVEATSAAASCAGPTTPGELLAQEDGVVLATVREVEDHRVLLDVEEVWSGGDRSPRTWITTGETSAGVEGSGDVDLEEDRRYLVGLLGDRASVCSVLVVDGPGGVVEAVPAAQVDAARPDDVRAPVEGADAGDAPGPPVAAVAAGLGVWAALTAFVLLAGRSVRRHQQRRSRRSRAGGPPSSLR
ncbi:hypothetical protein WDZ17_08735 [Pseudokineococcus basanitobsidens]|uniref:Uncharacterized protein n=1 Tax=Pseudokineococcus basanitobsidens TaxID=1926649 RepID=A0ABU8RK65_9ACTN